MNEEQYIEKLIDRHKSPFTTPEGYFDHLADSIISRLPEQERPAAARVVRWRPWLYAAAFAGFVAISATLFFNRPDATNAGGETMIAATTSNAADYSYFDDAADYAMVDNQDIYASLLADM